MSCESQVMSQIWLLKLSLVRGSHGVENEVAVSPLVLGVIYVVHESEVLHVHVFDRVPLVLVPEVSLSRRWKGRANQSF
jgi:hypothetical protein